MPSLDIIRTAVAELPKGPPLVAALAGGTTGIGNYIAKALALTFAKHGARLRVYIIGRNVARAEALIAECQALSPGSEWRFVQASDLALISEVDRCSADIIRQETEAPFHGGPPRLDLLYMTHCYPILAKPTVTPEGLDSFISTTYYSRIRFIMQLLPLLTASPLAGRVVSVYAGSFEDGTKPGEMPIGCPPPATYGVNGVRKHSAFMKTFVFEELAEKHAGQLSLTHIYPGLVDGPGFYSLDMPSWFRIVWRLLKPLAWLYMTSPEDCGQVMLYMATPSFPAKGAVTPDGLNVARSTESELGGGAYSLGQRADDYNEKRVSYDKVRKDDTSSIVWEHTMTALDEAKKKAQSIGQA